MAQPTSEGLAAAVLDHLEMLTERGWAVELACPDDGGLLPEKAREWGLRVHDWPAVRSPVSQVAREVARLNEILDVCQPDVVHLQSSKAGLSGRMAVRGRIPTIFSPHAWSFLPGGPVQQFAALRWERAAQRWTDVIVCCSESERQMGRSSGLSTRAEVVLNSVRMDRPPTDRETAREVLAGTAIDGSSPLAVCVARLTSQKGQDVLLDAWPRIRRHVPNAQLALVGDGDLAESLKARALPGVHFIGRVPRETAAEWTSAADVVVAPSRYEGLSISVLESLALGRPVVAADAQGMSEALSAGGGEVVPREDPTALADAVVPYLANRSFAVAQGEAAYRGFSERWVSRFSEAGDVLDGVYRSVVRSAV